MKARRLFLSLLGGIYSVAFISYWYQYEGLLGIDGLMPLDTYFDQQRARHASESTSFERWLKKPILLWFAPNDFSVDVFQELTALIGFVLSSLAAFGVCHHGILFGTMWTLYLGLYNTGQTFYSFQATQTKSQPACS